MSANEIDDYLAVLPEEQREALQSLRVTLRRLLPEAEEGLSYSAPAFRLDGTAVAGFAAAAKHLSYLPHSGTVTATRAAELADYATTKGAVKFTPDHPLSDDLVAALVTARLAELHG